MAIVSREVKEGMQVQGEDEQIAYSITTTPWGSDPSSVVVVVKDESADFADVTDTVTSGSASANGDIITTPIIKSLTAGRTYRVEVKFASGANVFECYFRIRAER